MTDCKAFGKSRLSAGSVTRNERFAKRADDLRQSTAGSHEVWAIYSPAMTFVASLGFAAVFWLGGSLVAAHKLTIANGRIYHLFDVVLRFLSPNSHGLNRCCNRPAPPGTGVRYSGRDGGAFEQRRAGRAGARGCALRERQLHLRPGPHRAERHFRSRRGQDK